jgi:signal transduction histidine kinase
MNRLRQNRLLLQLLFTVIAAVSLAAISALLISDAVRGAESVVVGETKRTLTTALQQLREQQRYRSSSDPYWSSLPKEARDVSLRGITDTVLRSYPGVEGGFYAGSGSFLGYAYPTHDTGTLKTDVPAAESGLIATLAERSLGSNTALQQVVRGRVDLLVIAAERGGNPGTAVWAMKRLAGRAHSDNATRTLLLVTLAIAALGSIAGTLATGISLARGVAQVQAGLGTLERDFDFRLPERKDELGKISRAINRMAASRRKLEADLRREDRLRALGRLAAGLAHEIRNPLNSIRLTVQLLESRLQSGRVRPTDLETVRTEVDRLSALLNDLLDLQRTRQPVVTSQPVLPVLEHCTSLLSRQADLQGVRIQVLGGHEEISARFDSQQLTQALMNLLLNALEASRPGDLVEVRVRENSGNDIAIEVCDSGPGLDPDQQDHLFEPFFTTKAAGTGLGLAVSRELMRSQGGDLLYDGSRRGACFVIHLPRN